MTCKKDTAKGAESKKEKLENTELNEQKAKILALNDSLRKFGFGGKVFVTRGVNALGNEFVDKAIEAMRYFNEFTSENDPYGEHDFGSFVFQEKKFFWKIDYYDLEMKHHSPNPADPEVTVRVLTLMLAEEY